MALAAAIQRAWNHRGPVALALWPLSCLYGLLGAVRRQLYRAHVLHSERVRVPVIVVGNVIAGGAGKTPVTQAIVRHLQAQGRKPGVVSRGYGRQTTDCREVHPDSQAADVGDEPKLIALTTSAPVFVAKRRAEAAHALLARHPDTDVIVCDDGLQHLALARNVQVCVFNDDGVGNGFLLPAGPLREPWPRDVDLVLHSGAAPAGDAPSFAIRRTLAPYALRADGSRVQLQSLRGTPVHALAAVARPQDFFDMLRGQHGLHLQSTEALPDHHDFNGWQRPHAEHGVLLCTEKDAVKLWPLCPDALAVPLEITVPDQFFSALDERLAARAAASLSSPSP